MRRNLVFYLLLVNLFGICVLIFLYIHPRDHLRTRPDLLTNPDFYFDRHGDPLDRIIRTQLKKAVNRQERQLIVRKNETLLTDRLLSLLAPVPRISESDRVDELEERVLKMFQKLENRKYNASILILTPIHNIGRHLYNYAKFLKSLSYPRYLVSVALGEDDSNDDTVAVANNVTFDLKNVGFKSAKLFTFNFSFGEQVSDDIKHDIEVQRKRRHHLALARNRLLKDAFHGEDWVLWIDSDLSWIPEDLVEQLLFPDKDIVVPCCLFDDRGDIRVYDKNTWRETPVSLEEQRNLSEDELVLEGYSETRRIYLPDLRAEGRVVPIDGVGGCSLLIRGKCHKDGLKFPENVYQHHIETEGLAKMAKTMGYSVYGLPFVEVYH